MEPCFIFKVDDLIGDFITETVCVTSDKKKAIQVLEDLYDYNVTVFKNGEFYDIFEHMTEEEFEQF